MLVVRSQDVATSLPQHRQVVPDGVLRGVGGNRPAILALRGIGEFGCGRTEVIPCPGRRRRCQPGLLEQRLVVDDREVVDKGGDADNLVADGRGGPLTRVEVIPLLPGWRTATVGDKVVGVPALVDNLTMVYKQDAVRAGRADTADASGHGMTPVRPQPTIPRRAGMAGQSRRTPVSWHYLPMLWEAGGDILTPHAALLRSRCQSADHAAAEWPSPTSRSTWTPRTRSTRSCSPPGMLVTGPWDLGTFSDVDYGVRSCPPTPRPPAAMQAISGPDLGGVATTAHNASGRHQLVKWLTAAPQVKSTSLATAGALPTRRLPSATTLRSSQSSMKSSPARKLSRSGQREEGQADCLPVSEDFRGAGPGHRVRYLSKARPGRRARHRGRPQTTDTALAEK